MLSLSCRIWVIDVVCFGFDRISTHAVSALYSVLFDPEVWYGHEILQVLQS